MAEVLRRTNLPDSICPGPVLLSNGLSTELFNGTAIVREDGGEGMKRGSAPVLVLCSRNAHAGSIGVYIKGGAGAPVALSDVQRVGTAAVGPITGLFLDGVQERTWNDH